MGSMGGARATVCWQWASMDSNVLEMSRMGTSVLVLGCGQQYDEAGQHSMGSSVLELGSVGSSVLELGSVGSCVLEPGSEACSVLWIGSGRQCDGDEQQCAAVCCVSAV